MRSKRYGCCLEGNNETKGNKSVAGRVSRGGGMRADTRFGPLRQIDRLCLSHFTPHSPLGPLLMTLLNTIFILGAAFLAVFWEAAFHGVRHLLGAQVDLLPALMVY